MEKLHYCAIFSHLAIAKLHLNCICDMPVFTPLSFSSMVALNLFSIETHMAKTQLSIYGTLDLS